MMTSSLYFFQSVYKTCQRQAIALKLRRLIVYSKVYKICKCENHVTRIDVIMMSLPKTMENNGQMRTNCRGSGSLFYLSLIYFFVETYDSFENQQNSCRIFRLNCRGALVFLKRLMSVLSNI